MESFTIPFIVIVAIILTGRRFVWIPVRDWLTERCINVTFGRTLVLVFIMGIASTMLNIGGPIPSISVMFVMAAAWFYFWRSVVSHDVISGAPDVIADAAGMKALAAPFEPEPFIRKAKPGETFMGLDQNRKPIFFPHAKLTKNHIEILGESGTGKSSLAGVLLSQLAAAGQTLVVFDPKADRILPGVLLRAGQEHGFPVLNIDLRYGQPAQINPFLGARRDQVEELLQVGLGLGQTGNAAVDFHRGKDREATGWMAAAFADGETSMPELLSMAGDDQRVTEQENLWREFRQIARVPAFQVHQGQGGHDLAALLSRSGVIYITGSTTKLEVQAAQKLILQRILQILDERRDQSRPVGLFLDELKYLLSPAALRAAGTIRDRNAHMIFAHQSIGDLSDCPGLDPKAVRGAVWGNCGIKFCYKSLDAETARELSLISGERAVFERRVTVSDNGVSEAESIGKAAHMPPHTFTHLPKPTGDEASVGVVIGDGPAYFLSTRWLKSGPSPEAIPARQAGASSMVIPAAAAAAFATADAAFGASSDTPAANIPAPNDAILAADFDDFLK